MVPENGTNMFKPASKGFPATSQTWEAPYFIPFQNEGQNYGFEKSIPFLAFYSFIFY